MPSAVLSALELAQLQSDNQDHMNDTCDIMTRSDTLNNYGEPVPTWTAAYLSVPCGFEFSPFKFRARETGMPGMETSEILVRARLPIAYYDTVSQNDRLRLTHRFGVALNTSETYEVQGFTERGPSGLVVNLQRVEP